MFAHVSCSVTCLQPLCDLFVRLVHTSHESVRRCTVFTLNILYSLCVFQSVNVCTVCRSMLNEATSVLVFVSWNRDVQFNMFTSVRAGLVSMSWKWNVTSRLDDRTKLKEHQRLHQLVEVQLLHYICVTGFKCLKNICVTSWINWALQSFAAEAF